MSSRIIHRSGVQVASVLLAATPWAGEISPADRARLEQIQQTLSADVPRVVDQGWSADKALDESVKIGLAIDNLKKFARDSIAQQRSKRS